MLIKAHTKLLEIHRGKLDKETNEKTIEVASATLVIFVIDEYIIIKSHKNVLDPYASSQMFHLLVLVLQFLFQLFLFLFQARTSFFPSLESFIKHITFLNRVVDILFFQF
jgi:hypothetical protein